jgi:HAE1 family hydrophobic/amphiphilic exporter-1
VSIADLSIKRPVFITCIFALILIVGGLAFKNIGIDLFPKMDFPIVVVSTIYPGAGPTEIENEVSKVIEDEVSTLSGIKTVRSISREGVSIVIIEFTQETDIKYATQQVRDRIGMLKNQLPSDAKDSTVRNVDPADQPIAVVGISANLSPGELFDLTDERIKSRIEQVSGVGLVEIYGTRQREIHVELDHKKLKQYELSASMVNSRIATAGKNIPAGKVIDKNKETVIRSIAEFGSIKDIGNTIVSFLGNDVPVTVNDVGRVVDGLTEETSRTFIDGKPAAFLYVYKQSGANTVSVFKDIRKAMEKLNTELKDAPGKPQVSIVQDGAKPIELNVADVQETIIIGIILTIIVVYFFLGSMRSTFITGIALPNSLIGAFILLALAGFTINVISLLGLSLAVGLLIDDAIVVRENIFRHMEMGKPPAEAASIGTKEVALAVIATTMCILAVFGPVSFIKGIIGRVLREFGLTVCFAMLISLFDSLTMGPMLSAYAGGVSHKKKENVIYHYTLGAMLRGFDRFQEWLSVVYERSLRTVVRWPTTIIILSLGIFVFSLFIVTKTPKSFMTPMDLGEMQVSIDMPAGTTLDKMTELTREVEQTFRKHPEVSSLITTVGNSTGDSNTARIYMKLVPRKQRAMTTTAFKETVRNDLKKYAYANPKVSDTAGMGGGGGGNRAFTLNIIGNDMEALQKYTDKLLAQLRQSPHLKEVDTSYRVGKPEEQIYLTNNKAEQYGITSAAVGGELRTLIEGSNPGVYRENGHDYDIRVRLQDEQRNINGDIDRVFIPNINGTLIRLADIATVKKAVGPATINRQDRGRYIQISADLATGGGGLGKAKSETEALLTSGELKLPEGMRYAFTGQAESFAELITGIITATLLGIAFIYLVLASLYESFITPFTIMLVFPLALSGGFLAVYYMGYNLDMMAMIGCVMLIGLATKNSILLVDYAHQLVDEGHDRVDAIIKAGRVRLRPILMTSIALVAGMLPIAIGLSEVSSQRAGMGVAVIGGVISSTLLTLIVIPAVYSDIERFREWSLAKMKRLFSTT